MAAFFMRGELIEVASKEDGFVGSYYEATIVTKLLRDEYIVQYKTLVKDDFSGPLREVALAAEVRPPPPPVKIPATGLELYDRVDAFDNDGWWVGTITGRLGNKYFVYFETTGDEIAYSIDKLRFHQDWVSGEWVISTKKSY